jgi:hypothetical protein
MKLIIYFLFLQTIFTRFVFIKLEGHLNTIFTQFKADMNQLLDFDLPFTRYDIIIFETEWFKPQASDIITSTCEHTITHDEDTTGYYLLWEPESNTLSEIEVTNNGRRVIFKEMLNGAMRFICKSIPDTTHHHDKKRRTGRSEFNFRKLNK